MEYSSPINTKLKAAYGRLATSIEPQFAVTLMPNQSFHQDPMQLDWTIQRLRRDLAFFHARLDKLLLGRKWDRAPSPDRSQGIWVPEQISGNAHLHGALALPPYFDASVDEIRPILKDSYGHICPSGVVHVADHPDSGWVDYITKHAAGTDWIWLASEFHSPRSTSMSHPCSTHPRAVTRSPQTSPDHSPKIPQGNHLRHPKTHHWQTTGLDNDF